MLAKTPDVCVACHKDMKERMAKEKVHQPADDCSTCHQPHDAVQEKLLVQPVFQICEQCHDVKDKAFAASHIGIEAKSIACASCHDPHSSKDPKFFKPVVHPPFAGRQCDACHVTGGK
jgi:predicted CXXCH cytochrome family protein